MVTKQSFGHDIEAIALTLRNLETNLLVANNALKQARSNIEFIREISDVIHGAILPTLPEENNHEPIHTTPDSPEVKPENVAG